ncbi:MAG: hypothetical protein OEY59_03070 [Deltaproteobacteria bacterium]|nr:hypothetical protein [Deltaproteobacteria bacterium]
MNDGLNSFTKISFPWIANLVKQWPDKDIWFESFTSYLTNCHYEHPERISRHFEKLRLVKNISRYYERILPCLIYSGHPETAVDYFLRFLESYKDKSGVEFDLSGEETEGYLRLFGWSDFLSQRLISTPLLADSVKGNPHLKTPKPKESMLAEMGELFKDLGQINPEQFKKNLRDYKYRELLRISIKDLCGFGSLKNTWRELSFLADCCLWLSLRAAYMIVCGKGQIDFNDVPVSEDDFPFVVMGMGKLGGDELNYSSDIDLFFLYQDVADQAGSNADMSKIRQKIARLMIDFMSERTQDGFIQRIDLRLRPGGETSPIFCSLQGAESYYAYDGQLWERQALIKASPVAGNIKWGNEFQEMIRPFIFSRSIDENTLKKAKHIKERIEKEHLKEDHLNVKLGIGGIREIEFFIQCFQLLYGGHKPQLRKTNSIEALKELRGLKILTQSDAELLEEAYCYLRKLEHRLQMAEELQIHTLPKDLKKQESLARSMGYWEEDLDAARRHLIQDIKDWMSKVRSIFSGLFNEDHIKVAASIKNSTKFNKFTPDVEKLIEEVSRQITASIGKKEENRTFDHFQRLFENIGSKLHYYEYLNKHPSLIQRISRIAETSDFLWNYMLNHLDLLLQLDSSEPLHTKTDWKSQLEEQMSVAKEEEDKIDMLREFKHSKIFLTGSAELDGIIPFEQARQRLTNLAEVVLQKSYLLAKAITADRFGPIEMKDGFASFAVIAMGKLGGQELTYHSDLDLIFVYNEEGKFINDRFTRIQEYYSKVVQRLITIISAYTRLGFAYKLDTRLRPSGNAGAIVTSLQAYLEYHKTSPPWEHQALIKSRIVAGDQSEGWIDELKLGIEKATYYWDIPDDLQERIQHLRERKEKEIAQETKNKRNLKEGYGGLLDIEFLTQYLQLKHGRDIPEIRGFRTLASLKKMGELGVLPEEISLDLIDGYKFLCRLESYLRLLNDTSTSVIDFDQIDHEKITFLFQRQGKRVEDLVETYQKTTHKIREIYQQFLIKPA